MQISIFGPLYPLDKKEHRTFLTISSILGYSIFIPLFLSTFGIIDFIPSIIAIVALGLIRLTYDYCYLKQRQLQDLFGKNLSKSLGLAIILIVLVSVVALIMFYKNR